MNVVTKSVPPDPAARGKGKETEVSPKAKRRRFTAAEKLRILAEVDAADATGGVGAVLRREGLYSSHLATWRNQRDAGQFGASARKRGPVAKVPDARDQQIVELERRAVRAERRAERAERVIEIQKKVSELLGIRLPDPESEPSR